MENKPVMRRTAIIGAVSALVVLLGATLTSAAWPYDSMFKTENTDWNCTDQGNGTIPSVRRFCRTDNVGLTVYIEGSINATGNSRIRGRLNNEFNPTDLIVTYAASPVYTGGSETDIIYQRRALPANTLGTTWCDDAVSTLLCDQHYVAFRNADAHSPFVACHETGHAVGLTHGAQAHPKQGNKLSALACMRTPYSSAYAAILGSAQREQINATYN